MNIGKQTIYTILQEIVANGRKKQLNQHIEKTEEAFVFMMALNIQLCAEEENTPDYNTGKNRRYSSNFNNKIIKPD